MTLTSWARASVGTPARGGGPVTSFRESYANALGDLVEPGAVTEEQPWDGLAYFLRAAIPVAEEHGVCLARHPDDLHLVRCIELCGPFGLSGAVRADHKPTSHSEDNSRPAHGTIGRLYALGYLAGLIYSSAADARARARAAA